MSTSPVLTANRKSVVACEGHLVDGTVVVQNLSLDHSANAPEAALLGEAIKMIRQIGGLMIDGEKGDINFYPMLTLKKINFSVERVSLALGSLPARH